MDKGEYLWPNSSAISNVCKITEIQMKKHILKKNEKIFTILHRLHRKMYHKPIVNCKHYWIFDVMYNVHTLHQSDTTYLSSMIFHLNIGPYG